MDILLFGIQGSGKGTQANLLASKYNLLQFGSGLVLREYAQNVDSALAEEIKHDLRAGELVRDDIIFQLLREFLDKQATGSKPIIFDGLPRNMTQMHILAELLNSHGRKFHGVYFDVSVSETLRRIRSRRHCGECGHAEVLQYPEQKCSICGGPLLIREDDQEEKIIMKRFQTFYQHTFPVIAHLMMQKKLEVIEAYKSPDVIFQMLDTFYAPFAS